MSAEIAQAIRDAGQMIAQAIMVAFLEPEEQQERQEHDAEQAEIERVMKLQRGEPHVDMCDCSNCQEYSNMEAKGIGDS